MKSRLVQGVGLTLAATFGVAAPASADSVVDTLGDSAPDDPPNGCEATGDGNLCTLREAVDSANVAGTNDVITFQTGLSGTLTLIDDINVGPGGGLGALTILGPGPNLITISGNDSSRIFDLHTPDYFSVSHLTLTGGNVSGEPGGAIRSDVANGIQVYDAAIVGNTTSGTGGGINVDGDGETLTIDNSTVSGNNAGTSGGGIWADETEVVISNSTISGNHALTGEGGGVDVYDNGAFGDSLITASSTITANTSATVGGGIYFLTAPDTTELTNTIVADNTAPDDPDVGIGTGATLNLNASFSVIENPGSTTILDGVPVSNITGTDPLLGPLQLNGGSLQTRLPAFNSPVVDKGREPDIETDQRGKPRPFDVPSIGNSTATGANAADIGSVELTLDEATPPVTSTPSTPTAAIPTTPATKKKCKKKGRKKKSAAAAKKKKCKKKRR